MLKASGLILINIGNEWILKTLSIQNRFYHFYVYHIFQLENRTAMNSWAYCISCSTLAYLVQYKLKKLGDFLYIYIYIIFTLILLLIIPSQKNRLVHSPLRYECRECRKWVEGWSVLDVATPLLAPLGLPYSLHPFSMADKRKPTSHFFKNWCVYYNY